MSSFNPDRIQSSPAVEAQDAHDIESIELALDGFLEDAIFDSAHKIDEGAEGIVVSIDLSKIPKEYALLLSEASDNPDRAETDDQSQVAKVLKIYTTQSAEKEAEKQRLAIDILSSADASIQKHVGIPRVDFARDVTLTRETVIEKLQELGVHVTKSESKIGVIIMERIAGMNLRVWAYREYLRASEQEVARRYPNFDLEQYLATHMSEASLWDMVTKIADSLDEGVIDGKIKARLQFRGLMDKEKVNAFNQLVELWHEKRFFHRDLHWKNIMIGDDGKLYPIDFATALQVDNNLDIHNSKEVQEAVYDKAQTVTGRSRLRDVESGGFLIGLAKTPNENPLHPDMIFGKGIANNIKLIKKYVEQGKLSKLSRSWDELIGDINAGKSLADAVELFVRSVDRDHVADIISSNWFAAALFVLNDLGYHEQVVSSCDMLIKKSGLTDEATGKLRTVIERIR